MIEIGILKAGYGLVCEELFKIEGEWAGANFTNEANIPYKANGGFS